jgi:uncharacterized protein YndB with AHSA1/START domain
MNNPRKSTRSGTRGYAHLVEIDVPVARVWRALTDAALVRIWSAQEAEIDARKGGFYRIGKHNAGGREAHIDIFDSNRRLRLIYLASPGMPSADSAVVDDFLLDVRKGEGTASLRLLGSGVPDAPEWDKPYMKMRVGWERLLARIKLTLETPPPKPKVEEAKDPPLPGLDY